VGVEDRDWYRQGTRTRSSNLPLPGALIVVALIAGLSLAGGVLFMIRGTQPTFEGEKRTVHGDTKVALIPGLPAITLHHESLYWPHDQWTAYLADEKTCPGAERTDLPLAVQAQVMVCLVNYARKQRGLTTLTPVALLDNSSVAKAERIVRCKEFKHAACDQDPASDARAAGYTGSFGENLYIADGQAGAPRVALDGWLNSPGHRENLFRPEWRTQGIAVQTLEGFGPYRHAALWVNEFGTS
jgi:uncharacterized protein YkwD